MRYILVVLFLLFSGCSIKNYEHTHSKIIIIKTPKLKYSDLGYIRYSDDAVELELFVAGRVVRKIEVNHLVCTTEGCMRKSTFNAEYLNAAYPENILQNILLGHAIYNNKNRVRTDTGFTQEIKNNSVDIKYKVDAKSIYFKDRKNRIIFKIKDMK